jgi:hypothetical protein
MSNIELEGKTIETVRPMNEEELERNYWSSGRMHAPPIVIVLEDGTKLYPSKDPEGNGPGAMFGEHPDGEMFGLIPKA